MSSIVAYMQQNHRQCDELFAQAEEAVANSDWDKASNSWQNFRSELFDHIDNKEETILFTALEAVNGPTGPTMVMRQEHAQIRALVTQMDTALEAKDSQTFLGLAETLMITTQQHNMKEEQILYPMMDNNLSNAAELIAQMEN